LCWYRKELHLENLGDPNPFMTPLQRADDRQRATQAWVKICSAMNVLQITGEESRAICSVLAAIYHIGLAGAAKGTAAVSRSNVLFCSLAVLDPRVGHTMDVLSPSIPVLCHSD